MQYFFENKVIVITGATDGIGKALVSILSAWNTKIIACGKDPKKVKKHHDLFGSHTNTFYVLCDISQREQCENLIKTAIKKFGRIDILINNAGVSMRAEFENVELSVIETLMQVNFLGAVYMTKAALPFLCQSEGVIVGISSVAGYRATPGRSGYSASKFALNGFLESLRVELRDKKVKVMTIAPGFIASNIRFKALDEKGAFTNDTQMKEKKMMTAETCALLILWSIKNKKSRIIFTFLGKITVLLNKLMPKLMDKLVYRFYYNNKKLVK